MGARANGRNEAGASVEERVDRELKLLWRRDTPRDYRRQMLFREDSLKAAIYHHLRRRLTDSLLVAEGIRVWTDFGLDNYQRADIAVVRLVPESTFEVESILAIVECKCKAAWVSLDYFQQDVDKVRYLSRLAAFRNALFYLASIWERPVEPTNLSMLLKRQQESWGKRVAELVGYKTSYQGPMRFTVLSHNGLNADLER
jgi:hypothetical protein